MYALNLHLKKIAPHCHNRWRDENEHSKVGDQPQVNCP